MTFEELAEHITNGDIKAPFCGLCRGIADHTALYLPPEGYGRKLGQPAGKIRMIPYGVCDACLEEYGEEAVRDRIEELILKQYLVQ